MQVARIRQPRDCSKRKFKKEQLSICTLFLRSSTLSYFLIYLFTLTYSYMLALTYLFLLTYLLPCLVHLRQIIQIIQFKPYF